MFWLGTTFIAGCDKVERGMASITVTGKIQWFDFGTGAWGLVANNGQIYELGNGLVSHLEVEGLAVKITGHICDDVMTIAAIGPVLAIESYERL